MATISNKEAADKLISTATRLTKLEKELCTSFAAFQLINVEHLHKVKQNLLDAAFTLQSKL
jgi:hypothetical protein